MKVLATALIATILGMGMAAAPAVQGRPSGAKVRVGVVSANGSVVRGLTSDGFLAMVDGMPAEVRSARPDTQLPVLVLVDVTTSTPGSPDQWRSPIAGDVLGVLAPGTPVRVAAIGRTLHAPGGWSTNRGEQQTQLRQALDVPAEDRHGPSPVWDALDESLRTLLPADARAGILLVTDGQTSGNRVRLAVPADQAIAMGVPINVVFTGSVGRLAQRGDTQAVVRPDRALEQLASATGGAFFNRSAQQRKEWDGGPGGDPLRRAAVSLSEGYLLEVIVQAKQGFQRLSVTTRDASLVVRGPIGLVVR